MTGRLDGIGSTELGGAAKFAGRAPFHVDVHRPQRRPRFCHACYSCTELMPMLSSLFGVSLLLAGAERDAASATPPAPASIALAPVTPPGPSGAPPAPSAPVDEDAQAPGPPTSSEPPPSGPVKTFASLEEGMGIASADGDFAAALHLLLQSRFEHAEGDAGRQDGFRVVLARPALRGVAFGKWIKYLVQWELATTPALLDAEVVVSPVPEIGLKVGQFLTPFSREFLISPGALLFPDFAPSNVALRDNRDTGAMLLGAVLDQRLEYFAAAVNGNGIDQNGNDNAQLEWIGRLTVNAIGKNPYSENPQLATSDTGLAIGLDASYADVEQTATTFDPTTGATTKRKIGSSPTTKIGADVSFHAGPLSLQIEGYSRTVQAAGGGPRTIARGGFAQAGVFVVPKTIELAARGDLVATNATRSSTLDERVDGEIAWYVRGDHVKLQLRYAWADSPHALAPSPAGTSNTVTLQGQLWF